MARRLWSASTAIVELVLRLLLVLSFVFVIVRMLPLDPALAIAGLSASPEILQTIREELGLDQTLSQQYRDFIARLLQLDIGTSLTYGEPVLERIWMPFLTTLILALTCVVITLIVVGAIVACQVRRGRRPVMSWVLGGGGLMLTAVPVFVYGIGALVLFGVAMQAYPLSGMPTSLVERFLYLLLPAGLLSIPGIVGLGRVVVTQTDEYRATEWFGALKTLGLGTGAAPPILRYVLHGLKRIITVYASNLLIYTFNGAIVMEIIYSIPGIGFELYMALLRSDYTVVEGIVLLSALFLTVVQWATDTLAPIEVTEWRAGHL